MKRIVIMAGIILSLAGCENKIEYQEPIKTAEIMITEVTAQVAAEVTAQVHNFEATAYCDHGITFSGVYVQRGIVAGDPHVLPIGSIIEVEAGSYSGVFSVMDTGRLIKGRIIDIFIPDYEEAIQFGRQQVTVKVIRLGWNPDYQMAMK